METKSVMGNLLHVKSVRVRPRDHNVLEIAEPGIASVDDMFRGQNVFDDFFVEKDIAFDDHRWRWTGDWQRTGIMLWRTERVSNISGHKGAEAAISFTGTGASIIGILLPNGGKAEVYLDGELSRAIDVYPDEPMAKARESIWHVFGLENKRHDVLVVVLGESFGDSQGTDISISGLLVFQQ